MAYIALTVAAPHATPYDASYPTRSTENYAHALHTILKAQADAGWSLFDNVTTSAQLATIKTWIRDQIKEVFDYADGAITTYRSSGTATLLEPTTGELSTFSVRGIPALDHVCFQLWTECMKMQYKIYYMWKTEEDPLLLKEKLQELLVAWPLTDTEVILSEEGGQSLRVVPAWKNVDI